MKHISPHIRLYIMRGIMAIIPITLCAIAVILLYKLIDRRVMTFLEQFFDVRDILGFGLLLLLVFLYLIGMIASNVVGRQALGLIEYLSSGIPGIKHIYSLSKQMGDVLGRSDHDVFKKAVLVNFPSAQQRSVGLVTGRIRDENTGEGLLEVYMPYAHPAIGFLLLVRESQAKDAGMSVEDALKMVVSLGIIAPQKR